jgi:enoyl-CoA hydratase/carnithine racemase
MSDGASPVLLEIDDDGVALLTLNRPESRNAWVPSLEQAFYEVLDVADHDPAVRVAVLTGAGKTFCPGVGAERLERVAGHAVDYTGRPPFSRTLGFRKPLIAAINGGCAGAGLVQAMMCDVRFASDRARLSTSFARRGLPAEHGLAWLLPRIIGVERALDLLLTGRTVDADEALQLGLVSRVVSPDALLPAALAYARDIAVHCAPVAVSVIKHQVQVDLDSDFGAALDRAYRVTVALSAQTEFREGVDSYLQKREPSFPGLPAEFDPAGVVGVARPGLDVEPAGSSHAE